jgi:DNA-directed RNA polymerase
MSFDAELSKRIQLIASLAEAQTYREYDKIWFAYNLDSRGRVYTLQTLITPQSSSTVKAMLQFAEGELLDKRGEYWFKIHTANVYGKDKDEFDDRVAWFDNNIDVITSVGTSPLNCLEDWAYCDSPFEFLAACHDWVAHKAGERVHVPIQLDATNSGVQVYSGLLGDLAGAKTVNVVNTVVNNLIKRADVYGIVASKVNKALLSGNYPKMFHVPLSDGGEKSQSTWREAQSIAGKITRKHTKRNTMTVPYSVTKRGMQDQLWDLIHDAQIEEKEWWEGDPWVVNKLLTDLNHDAIYETIPGAKIGQDYLVALAALCNKKDGMMFTTPIYDIPVVQKKPRTEVKRVRTQLGFLQLKAKIPNSLDKMSQRNGSAPNFIHAIDSTLLLYMIDNMSKQIGVIHDCFIGHANDGDELQHVFKKGYVEIMKMRPLALLGAQLDPEGTIDVPYIGTLDLDLVMDAEYIIS